MYNILVDFGVPVKLVSLIKMCLTETYYRLPVGKNVSDMFPIRNSLKQGDALLPLISTLDYAIWRVQVNQDGLILNDQNAGRSYNINIDNKSFGRV